MIFVYLYAMVGQRYFRYLSAVLHLNPFWIAPVVVVEQSYFSITLFPIPAQQIHFFFWCEQGGLVPDCGKYRVEALIGHESDLQVALVVVSLLMLRFWQFNHFFSFFFCFFGFGDFFSAHELSIDADFAEVIVTERLIKFRMVLLDKILKVFSLLM